jgi:hypothetical protein
MYQDRSKKPLPGFAIPDASADAEAKTSAPSQAQPQPDFIKRFAPLLDSAPDGSVLEHEPLWVPVSEWERCEEDAQARRKAEKRARDREQARELVAQQREREREFARELKRQARKKARAAEAAATPKGEGAERSSNEAGANGAAAHGSLSGRPPPDIKWPTLTRAAQLDLGEHQERLTICRDTWPGWDRTVGAPKPGYVPVFDQATLGDLLNNFGMSTDSCVRARGAVLYRALCERGPMRQLGTPAYTESRSSQAVAADGSSDRSPADLAPADRARVIETPSDPAPKDLTQKELKPREPSPDLRLAVSGQVAPTYDPLEVLRRTCPHMSAVIDFVSDFLRKAHITGKPQRIPPILLLGGPGVGKTYFSHELAKLLGVPMHRVPMDQAMADFYFMGSDMRWSNTESGLIFEVLAKSPCANPVIVLDELDKAQREHRSALNTLHTLLEVTSSCHVRDLSVGLTMDASYITWIATANYWYRVPATLRSRFRVFHIEQPTGEQAITATQSVADALCAKNPGLEPIHRRVAVAMAHLSAREAYLSLERVVARVMAQGRTQVELSDLRPSDLGLDEAESGGQGENPSSGGSSSSGGAGSGQLLH